MSFEPRDYLRHILVEADYLVVRSAGVTFDEFAANDTLRRAFVRSLEIIGEAAKKVLTSFARSIPVARKTVCRNHSTGRRVIGRGMSAATTNREATRILVQPGERVEVRRIGTAP